ncbi:hypothetical protein H6F76_06665 [Leptolyngbya sp. FACHB-321]|uniref:hypothetical protein n=1 Tax=Leptolyngbya sp. FACHB-321 TaxID=2692807 RepID=UPI001682FE0D|nr:hypothetical protein [Leptolyngbya sp. FACHB-321]MBD2034714.1 hypothetical protein [Leptolyngbya sp. FACHB-321]
MTHSATQRSPAQSEQQSFSRRMQEDRSFAPEPSPDRSVPPTASLLYPSPY